MNYQELEKYNNLEIFYILSFLYSSFPINCIKVFAMSRRHFKACEKLKKKFENLKKKFEKLNTIGIIEKLFGNWRKPNNMFLLLFIFSYFICLAKRYYFCWCSMN